MATLEPPEFKKRKFACPYCGALSVMHWRALQTSTNSGYIDSLIWTVTSECCPFTSYWIRHPAFPGTGLKDTGTMLLPSKLVAPMAHPMMPEDIKKDYDEAREISVKSPRGAAALLRLAIQRLMPQLGEKGKYLDDDIASLVAKGLPVGIQKQLDIVRVIGNNAVHPGELSSDDVAAVSDQLFRLVNAIIEDRIARPKELEELYGNLPPKAIEAIEKRDGKDKA